MREPPGLEGPLDVQDVLESGCIALHGHRWQRG